MYMYYVHEHLNVRQFDMHTFLAAKFNI